MQGILSNVVNFNTDDEKKTLIFLFFYGRLKWRKSFMKPPIQINSMTRLPKILPFVLQEPKKLNLEDNNLINDIHGSRYFIIQVELSTSYLTDEK